VEIHEIRAYMNRYGLQDWVTAFAEIVGKEFVFTENEYLETVARDHTEDLHFLPELLLKPRTAEEISAILRLCNQYHIPLTPRGAGTGLSGGALATKAGIVLSTERLNNIIHIDTDNLQVITEPGVITEVLQNAVKEKGLFYPPDPSSKGSCFIGGNIAENSGGPKAVKYGVVKDYVLNLQVVLPTGEIIWTGANVLKNATGYNLTQLFVGSEGTLGIVTQIVLRLIPHPKHEFLMLVPFKKLEEAGAAVSAIFRAGFIPSVLELVEMDALKIVRDYIGETSIELDETMAGHLLIEVDGQDADFLLREMEGIVGVLESFECGEILFAEDPSQKEALWKWRRRVSEAVKASGYSIEEDTVVPRAALPDLIKGVKALAIQHEFDAVCYGHAGDGNLHIRIRKTGHPFSLNNPAVIPALRDLFKLVHQLGGTISGEHGIGLIQKEFMDIVFAPIALERMKQIKNVFDPNNILNPGKIFQ
jgi:glycolate oxidase